MITLYKDEYSSPIGEIIVINDGSSIVYLDFKDCKERITRLLTKRYRNFEIAESSNFFQIIERLKGYFNKDWTTFDDLKLSTGGTLFQKRVWSDLQAIPRGEVISYAQLANNVGNEKAVRAVASSNARNPLSIVIPCHRVIGKDGSLRGYAGGVSRKQWLLEHEGWTSKT